MHAGGECVRIVVTGCLSAQGRSMGQVVCIVRWDLPYDHAWYPCCFHRTSCLPRTSKWASCSGERYGGDTVFSACY